MDTLWRNNFCIRSWLKRIMHSLRSCIILFNHELMQKLFLHNVSILVLKYYNMYSQIHRWTVDNSDNFWRKKLLQGGQNGHESSRFHRIFWPRYSTDTLDKKSFHSYCDYIYCTVLKPISVERLHFTCLSATMHYGLYSIQIHLILMKYAISPLLSGLWLIRWVHIHSYYPPLWCEEDFTSGQMYDFKEPHT